MGQGESVQPFPFPYLSVVESIDFAAHICVPSEDRVLSKDTVDLLLGATDHVTHFGCVPVGQMRKKKLLTEMIERMSGVEKMSSDPLPADKIGAQRLFVDIDPPQIVLHPVISFDIKASLLRGTDQPSFQLSDGRIDNPGGQKC